MEINNTHIMDEVNKRKDSLGKEQFIEPEITVVVLSGVPISADSSVCCSFRGMVGYDS